MNRSRKPNQKKRIVRKIILWLLLILIIAACGYYAYVSLKAQYTTTYTGYKASIGTVSNSLSFSGNLALVDSETKTATSSSTVKKIYVEVGDNVKSGDKLMRLSNGTTIEAGIDGRVNMINVAVNDDVVAGDSLIQVADFTHLKVSFRIDEYDITEVSIGEACQITTTATEKTFDSTIDTIDYIASGGNVAYYTAVTYVDVSEDVYPGMQATVTVTQEEAKDVVILKEDALSFDATNKAYVMMYDENNELQQVDIELGVSNGNYVEIKSGLSDGDEVFVEVKVEENSNALGGLLGGIFGSTQMNQAPSMGGSGNFPDFGGSSGNFPNFSGGSGNSGGRSGGGSGSGSGGFSMPSGGFPGGGN